MVITNKSTNANNIEEPGDVRQDGGPGWARQLLARPFVVAVGLYEIGALVALLPVFGDGGDWGAAWRRLLAVSASVALFFVILLFFNRPGRLWWLAVAVAGAVAVVAVFGTAQVSTENLRLNGFNYRIYSLVHKYVPNIGPQVNQNVLGTFLAAFLPLPLAFALWGRNWLWRGYFAVCAGLVGSAVLVTASRSALLGLVTLFFAFALFLTAGRPRLTWLALAGLVVAAIGGGAYVLLEGFTSIESGASRLELWRTVLAIIGDYPVTGGGLGQLANHFLPYATPAIYAYPQPHAHNIFLQGLAEFGISGFVGLLLTLVTAVHLLVRYRQLSALEPALRPVVAGGVTGILVLFTSGLLEYGAWNGKFAPVFWVLPGMLAAAGLRTNFGPWLAKMRPRNLVKTPLPRRLLTGGAVLLLLLLLAPLFLVNIGKLLNDPAASAPFYQVAGTLAPWNEVPYRNLGALAQRQGNLAAAQRDNNEALKRSPDDWLTLRQQATLLENQGQHDAAISLWRQAHAEPYFIQLSRLELQRQPPAYPAAEKYVKDVLEINPHYNDAIQFLVGIYMATNRQAEASVFLADLVAKNNDPFIYHEAATWAPDVKQRINFLEQALRLDTQNSLYYWELGEAYRADGQSGPAVAAYERSLALKPGFQKPIRSLAGLYLDQNQPAQAQKLLESFLNAQLFVDKPDPEYTLLARTYLALKNPQAAVTASEKALSYNPSSVDANLALGESWEALGDKNQAVAAYSKTLQLDPANQAATQALARLGS